MRRCGRISLPSAGECPNREPSRAENRLMSKKIAFYEDDIPEGLAFPDGVAVDTESMGLNPDRDRLCLVQLSAGDGTAHLVRIPPGSDEAPRLKGLLEDPGILKIFHFARADIAMLARHLDARTAPVYCTKLASRLARTYTERHGLKDLCRELLAIDISKQQQQTDWGADTLTDNQREYAATDVLHLHRLRTILDEMLARERRTSLAEACFTFLPARAELDLRGWKQDIFSHA